MAITHLYNENFDQAISEAELPVLVDFWATWCGPCKMMGPVLEEIAGELDGKVKVCKVNVDDNPELAEKYNIMSIPNFILFKGGQVAGQQIGAVPKEALVKMLNA